MYKYFVHKIPLKLVRFFWFGMIGTVCMGLGALLLSYFIEVVHLTKGVAYLLQLVLVLQISFNLNNLITWRNNPNANSTYITRWQIFHTGRIVSFIGSQLLFLIATELEMEYMSAYIFDSLFWVGFNFFWGEELIFKKTLAKAQNN